MIQNLEVRAEFWAEHHRVPCQGDSITAPFKCFADWENLVRDRRVLEIGPGEGRQFKELSPLAKDYTVADIVPRVLENPIYENAGRHLIASYAVDDFHEKFEMICFWYVLHHVLRQEGHAFFQFIRRHLAENGEVLFNVPSSSQSRGLSGYDGNGVETTPWQPEEVVRMLEDAGLCVVRSVELAHNCVVIHARRSHYPSEGSSPRSSGVERSTGPQGGICLNLGGGREWCVNGWTNLEQDLGYDLASEGLRRFADSSVSRIFCSHVLEHMPVESARRLMRDVHRVLRPGGVLRLVLPDAEKFVRAWRDGDSAFYEGNPCLLPHFDSELDCLMHMGGNPESFDRPSKIQHWFFWDRYSLTWLLVCAGFRIVHDSSFGTSSDPVMREVATVSKHTGMPLQGFDNPLTESVSVYLEAVR